MTESESPITEGILSMSPRRAMIASRVVRPWSPAGGRNIRPPRTSPGWPQIIVRKRRLMWRRLPAWPWSWFGPNGRPPDGWWNRTSDATVAAAFKTWATDTPVLPNQKDEENRCLHEFGLT